MIREGLDGVVPALQRLPGTYTDTPADELGILLKALNKRFFVKPHLLRTDIISHEALEDPCNTAENELWYYNYAQS